MEIKRGGKVTSNPDFLIEVLVSAGQILWKYLKTRNKEKQADKQKTKPTTIETIKLTDKYIGGILGDKLLQALEEYKQTGSTKKFMEIKKQKQLRDVVVVVEIARRITMDIQIMQGTTPHYTITFTKQLNPKAISLIALFTYKIITLINALHQAPTIHLYMAVPITMAFQLGQLTGIGKYKIKLYQYYEGQYQPIPQIKRKTWDTLGNQ